MANTIKEEGENNVNLTEDKQEGEFSEKEMRNGMKEYC